MILSGWMADDGQSLTLPNFDRHNGKTAKTRAMTAKRVATHKAKSNAGSVTSSVSDALPREEKRREENINTPLPPQGEEDPSKGKSKTKRKPSETVGEFQPPKRFDTPEVRQALADFESMRLRTGKRIKDRSNVCRGWDTRFVDAKHLLACIDVAISNEYQGISPDYVDPSKVLEAKKPSLWETAKKY
jgi:hypothetical protein